MQPLDAERVREWRHRRMLSQQEVADRAGTSLFTIQRIERGEGNVRPRTGRGVAAALSVPIEDLLPKAQAPLPDFDLKERRAPVLEGPFRSDAFHAEAEGVPGTIYSPDRPRRLSESEIELMRRSMELDEERREAIYELAIEAARRQAVQDIQAANRALESEQAQAYFMRHENEAMHRLLEYPADELAPAVLELARRCVELEASRAVQLEGFPAEQVAAFLAENERDNELIRRELEKMSAAEFREALLAVSPRLRRYYREESTSRETSEEKQGRSA